MQLMGFALKSRPSLMISVAEYLEEKGELEKAVQLYQKAGEVTKALDLCFRAGAGADGGKQDGGGGGERNPAMFEALKSMMDDLGSHASPQVCFVTRSYTRSALGFLAECGRIYPGNDFSRRATVCWRYLAVCFSPIPLPTFRA